MNQAFRSTGRYLFLQGMATQFLTRLADALDARGHVVKRINFNAGDRLFWRLPGAVDYRGGIADWPQFLERSLTDWHITDIVLFGAGRPLHSIAIRVAGRYGIKVHMFEEGYFRPGWITLEQSGGMQFPRDAAGYRLAAALLSSAPAGAPVTDSFPARAGQDILYYVWSWLWSSRYPGYRAHCRQVGLRFAQMAVDPFREYAGWLRRLAWTPAQRRRTAAALCKLEAGAKPYYFFPLQLDYDSQIQIYSPLGNLASVLAVIIDSFARRAPKDTQLVIKEHPLDPHLTDWRALTATLARRFGVEDRIVYLVGGPLDQLACKSRGMVTVNSTSGLSALALHVPVVALARPIYDLEGLTFQHGLDRFWKEASAPDGALFDAFRRVVIDRTHINGGYFSAQAVDLAVAGSVARLESAVPRLIVAAGARG